MNKLLATRGPWLVANLIPVFGLIFLEWNAVTVLILYWVESVLAWTSYLIFLLTISVKGIFNHHFKKLNPIGMIILMGFISQFFYI